MTHGLLAAALVLGAGCTTTSANTGERPCLAQRQPPDRSCSTDADCTVVMETSDCCGSQAPRGVTRADASRYEQQEKTCPKVLRECRCEARVDAADDGTTGGVGASPAVACVSGACTSSFAPR